VAINTDSVRSVLITGASTGIGRACALHMDRLGWQVFAGVRKKADAESLRGAASSRLTPVLLDVSKPQDIRRAVHLIEKASRSTGLAGLINNAGIPYGGPVEFLDLDEVRRTFEVNFFGVIAVTQAFIPLLRRAPGRIVNISSISGLIVSPFLSPYTTSKFALEALSDALRMELSPWKVEVALIEPGAIDTPIWRKARNVAQGVLKKAPPAGLQLYGTAVNALMDGLGQHGISPDRVAQAASHALTSPHPRTRYRLGAEAPIISVLRLLPDRLRDRIFLSRLPRWG
jgi:NAD(P)-dependent dehydrogenase (short-subunit alcohol dehydrogenase family)